MNSFVPVPATVRCACGAWLPKGSTAERTTYGWRHCAACRPRQQKDNDQ